MIFIGIYKYLGLCFKIFHSNGLDLLLTYTFALIFDQQLNQIV